MASKQQDDLEREQEALYIDPSDFKLMAPAARCKECGVITWRVSIAAGLCRAYNAKHAKGCSRPPGKFDVETSEEDRHARLKLLEERRKGSGARW